MKLHDESLCSHGEPADECQHCIEIELQRDHNEWWESSTPDWWEELREIETIVQPQVAA